jgi:hypothetical protein
MPPASWEFKSPLANKPPSKIILTGSLQAARPGQRRPQFLRPAWPTWSRWTYRPATGPVTVTDSMAAPRNLGGRWHVPRPAQSCRSEFRSRRRRRAAEPASRRGHGRLQGNAAADQRKPIPLRPGPVPVPGRQPRQPGAGLDDRGGGGAGACRPSRRHRGRDPQP